jgi:hypothetical protein
MTVAFGSDCSGHRGGAAMAAGQRFQAQVSRRLDHRNQSTVQKKDIPQVATLPDLLAAACKGPEHGAVLLQGAAGAGKSTALRHITAHAFSEPQVLGLNGRHLPMVVRLQVLASVGGASIAEVISIALGTSISMTSKNPLGYKPIGIRAHSTK